MSFHGFGRGFRSFGSALLVATLGAAALCAGATSCSGPDPGQITFSERSKGSGGALDTPEGGAVGDGGGTGDGGGGGDASKEAGPAGDPVFGTTAFMAGMPSGGPAKGQGAHTMAGLANGDPSGMDCVIGGCHLDARPWAFGGTLYSDAAGTARVAGAEIRVTGPDGKVVGSTFSDVDGNFWLELGDPKIPANSRVGVRNAAGKMKDMGGTIGGEAMGGIGCQKAAGCHGAASPGKVFLN